jgi:hypothetical protein
MRTFLLKNKEPISKFKLLPDGVMYKGKVPDGYNLAISPSPGYVIIDVDNHEGKKNGFDIIPPHIMKEMKTTLHYNSKNNGMHCWFRYTGNKKLGNKTCGKGIDLRNERGYGVWWHTKPIEECLHEIKDSSELMNNWLEELFCYKADLDKKEKL